MRSELAYALAACSSLKQANLLPYEELLVLNVGRSQAFGPIPIPAIASERASKCSSLVRATQVLARTFDTL
jgi:hypothetical protein